MKIEEVNLHMCEDTELKGPHSVTELKDLFMFILTTNNCCTILNKLDKQAVQDLLNCFLGIIIVITEAQYDTKYKQLVSELIANAAKCAQHSEVLDGYEKLDPTTLPKHGGQAIYDYAVCQLHTQDVLGILQQKLSIKDAIKVTEFIQQISYLFYNYPYDSETRELVDKQIKNTTNVANAAREQDLAGETKH